MENRLNYLLELFSLDSIKHSKKDIAINVVNKIKRDYVNYCKEINELKIEKKKIIEEILSLKNNNELLKNNNELLKNDVKSKKINNDFLNQYNELLKSDIKSKKINNDFLNEQNELLKNNINSLKNEIDSLKNEMKINAIYYENKTTDFNEFKKNIIIQLNDFDFDKNYSDKKRRLE